MKKVLLSLTLLLAVVLGAKAQSFQGGSNTIGLSVGINNTLWDNHNHMLVPPFTVSYDHGIVGSLFDGRGAIGLGGLVSVYGFRDDAHRDWAALLLGPRGTLHYSFVDKLDTYVALMLGYSYVGTSGATVNGSSYGQTSTSKFGWGANVGLRYYIAPAWALSFEAGYGLSNFNFGFTYDF